MRIYTSQLNNLENENEQLSEENKKCLEAIQQTTEVQITTFTDTVMHLTNNLEIFTSNARASTSAVVHLCRRELPSSNRIYQYSPFETSLRKNS